MTTNIMAFIVISVFTNVYAPKQHLEVLAYATYPETAQERWVDGPASQWPSLVIGRVKERDNPDVRIEQVREVKTLTFEIEGRTHSVELSNVVLSERKRRRVVTSTERWEDAP